MNEPSGDIKSMTLYHHVDRVVNELRELGKTNDELLSVDELTAFDQLHYHGTEAVDEAIRATGIGERSSVLEIGSGLVVTPIPVPHRREFAETVAFRIEGPRSTVLFLPDIDGWDDWDEAGVAVEDEIARVDVAYLDGSFWFHGEIPGRDMSGFPHPMIKESLARFASLPSPERAKIRWIHLNHTNPAAVAGSEERHEVEAAGMRIAEQGEVVPL